MSKLHNIYYVINYTFKYVQSQCVWCNIETCGYVFC